MNKSIQAVVEKYASSAMFSDDSGSVRYNSESEALQAAEDTIKEVEGLLRHLKEYKRKFESGSLEDDDILVDTSQSRSDDLAIEVYYDGAEFYDDNGSVDEYDISDIIQSSERDLESTIRDNKEFIRKLKAGRLDNKDGFTDYTPVMEHGYDRTTPVYVTFLG